MRALPRASSTSQVQGAVGIRAVGIGRCIHAAGVGGGVGRGVNAAGVGGRIGRGCHIGCAVGQELRFGGGQSDNGEQAESEL